MIDRRHPNSYAAKHHPIGDSSEGLASYTQKKRTITRTQPRCLASPNLNGGIISLRSQEGLWRLCLTQPKGGHCGGLRYWTIISSPSLILMELRSFQVTARENVVRHRAACLDFYLELCVFFVFPVPLTSSPFSLSRTVSVACRNQFATVANCATDHQHPLSTTPGASRDHCLAPGAQRPQTAYC